MARGDRRKRADRSPLEVSFHQLTGSSSSVLSEPPPPPGDSEEGLSSAGSPPASTGRAPGPPRPPETQEEPVLPQVIVERYEGEKVHGLYHGEGTAYFQGGHAYKGMFSEGLMHEQGTYTWADGVQYQGDFQANVPTGHGVYTWPDGGCYEGQVWNGMRHGVGTHRCGGSTASYTGRWHLGKRHGKGAIYYNAEGTSWYEGDWVDNVREGWGVRCYSSGNVYEGQWKSSARHGRGTMRWPALRQQYSGQWADGIQQGQGTHTWFLKRVPGSQYPLRNEYVGEFASGLRHGHGRFYYASGALYDGHWQFNKKHGQGKFVFKNGRVFEGEFVDDHMAEFPGFSMDGTSTPDLSGIRTHTPPCGEGESVKRPGGVSSVLGPDMALDLHFLLERLPAAGRDAERKQVEFAILRHVAELRRVYSFYSSLGYEHSPDNTFLLTRLQFWRLLKDCRIQQRQVTLAQADRLLAENSAPEEIHSPFDTVLLRTFLSNIVVLAYHMYNKEIESQGSVLASCFSKLVRDNIIPHARNVKGSFFSNHLCAVVAVNYMEKCWEIHKAYCKQSSKAPFEPTMNMRDFMWMLKDLNLYSEELTTGKVLEILAAESPAAYDGTYSNLELEMTFLEFFEALLGCAEVSIPRGTRTLSESLLDDWKSGGLTKEPPRGDRRESPTQRGTLPPSAQAVTQDGAHKEDGPAQNELPLKSSSIHGTSQSSAAKKSEARKSKELLKPSESEERDLKQSGKSVSNPKTQPGHPAGASSGSAPQSAHSHSAGSGRDGIGGAGELVRSMPALHPEQPSSPPQHGSEDGEDSTSEPESELECWIQQMRIFFTQKLFPSYEHSLLVKREVAEERGRRAVRARMAKARVEEAARLKELLEAEDERRHREEEEEEEGDERAEGQEEDASLTPSPVAVASAPSITKPSPGSGRRKRK
ncbi:radial spoke head 10 homolog B isoform X1 [Lepisosteus oculatus]|uniref:radial spoke head 10 homolog B isoform X1 n=1 Tax=Lepisosteus oculatus TaxID=7918 RepID=UPI0035F52209